MSETPPADGYVRAAAAVATGLPTDYGVDLHVGRHRIAVDEPTSHGGGDSGPTPVGLLISAVASCTAITLRMYAERKSWPLEDIRVHVAYEKGPDGANRITRRIDLIGPLDDAQRARLLEIAERTPVTRAVREGTPIVTAADHHPLPAAPETKVQP
ncbi:OsmC family protein [Streptacidiphilus sp. MAP5-3]|uniref:OsmC family protein n=1 Tax=unclassified Streptacidiphilus TaxID=2643834 RepID=UPI003511DD02